ncbi:SPOR domain-containing protein [Pseudidiomarina homiensis]|uniref:SPOR domain-containing protein n=1 Tax=Pseudidiomarina homiensis TaxID=364198 RepID=UPI00215AFCA5|nr:SPOR domain-containing protein [Pseudidiomarina homiensis]
MASQLQNRIVGSIILIALAVIILPELLDGKQVKQQQELAAIPMQPDAEVIEKTVVLPSEKLAGTPIEVDEMEPLPDAVELTAEDAPRVAEAAGEEVSSEPAQPVTTSLSEPGYVIQLGAFSNAESVASLIKQLQEHGFAAYSEAAQVNGKTLNRLFVGPALSEAELEAQLPELQKLTGLSGRVVSYEP